LNYPAPGSTLRVQRPTLIINNAIDYQSDLMTYRFEVAADSQFSNIVAQVPSLSAGAVTTAWTLDSDLADGTQYWWRCRASDGVNTGAWMAAESFLVSLVNTPPSPVRLASPPPGSILSDLTATLGWFPAVETNIGDSVAAYQLQIASEPLFTNLVVNDSQVPSSSTPDGSNWVMVLPLSSFAGASGLVTNKTYFWRVRAEDTWNEYSSWSTGLYWFVYGNPPPNISGFSKTTSGIGFSWQPTGKAVYIDYTPKLVSPSWSEVAGPIYGTNWSLEASGTTSQGFYRARSE
jgi:hypothetical protein